MELWDHQKKILPLMKNGTILLGGTGSGKSLTSLVYGKKVLGGGKKPPKSIIVITTARKRDDGDWVREASKVGLEIEIDSWNNIKKYVKRKGYLFIFDEQRVVSSGSWSRSFLKITKNNQWIMLSATPADTWMDLITVFIANGFYRNRTQFLSEHVIFAPYVTFPKVTGYRNVAKLERLKSQIIINMSSEKHTKPHILKIKVNYDSDLVKQVLATQWDPYKDKPIENLAQETFVIRKIINSSKDRILKLLDIHKEAGKLIIFYNFTFELMIMKEWFEPKTEVKEWNGFHHDPVPEGDNWVYLVQYLSGAEAWECFTTQHMAFYSLNYSYRIMHQARGRINRHNTPFTDLYYYELYSESYLDKTIQMALSNKKNFNINMLTHPRASQLLL